MKKRTQICQALLGVAALIFTALVATGRLAWRTVRNWWKRRAKWLRYSMATALILLATGFLAHRAYRHYERAYGRDYYDRTLSNHITLHSFSDCKWRVYDNRTQTYTTDKINWVSEVPEEDSLAVYALPNKRGYINVHTGRIVIDAQKNNYRKAWVFSDGLAAVVKGDQIGFINNRNEVVIPFRSDYSDKCRMWDFGYVFHNGSCAMPDADGNLGLIDTTGKWIVEPAYDEIWAPHESGYRITVVNNKYGVLDSRGNVIYPAEYGSVDVLSDGFVLTKDGKKWQVDFEGHVVNPFLFDYTQYLNYPIGYNDCEDLQYAFADYAKYEVMNCYGILNRITGEPVTPAIYSGINMLSKDLFEVQEYDSYDWYLLDTKGNVVSKE